MITVDLVEPTPTKPTEAVEVLRESVFPMYLRFWEENIQANYNKLFNPHIALFIEMWFGGGLRILIAKDNDKTVGFAVCVLFRPLQYQASVLQVHDLYDGKNMAVTKALIDYIEQMAKMLNCDEIWYDQHNTNAMFSARWQEQQPMTIRRFIKQE